METQKKEIEQMPLQTRLNQIAKDLISRGASIQEVQLAVQKELIKEDQVQEPKEA